MRLSLISDTGAAAVLLLAACAGPEATVERRLGLMGTEFEIQVEAADRAAALAASETAVAALEAAEARLSTWRADSALAAANAAPVGVSYRLPEALAEDLSVLAAGVAGTHGAFDPAIGALVAAWGLRSGGRVPSAAERAAALAACGFGQLELDGRHWLRRHSGVQLEEGGFGKGVGLARALAALARTPARRARLNLGGQVAVYGRGPFQVEIADPRARDRSVLALTLERGSVATSGNSEHGFTADGVRYGHLLDPRTGAPAPDFGSATVWAEDPATADMLATGYFVLGPEAGLAAAAGRDDVAALFLEVSGGRLRCRAGRNWRGRLHSLDPRLDITWYP